MKSKDKINGLYLGLGILAFIVSCYGFAISLLKYPDIYSEFLALISGLNGSFCMKWAFDGGIK